MNNTKPFSIDKKEVYNAWIQVKKNKGSAGIDKVTIDKFELDLDNNLYILWNNLSSGAYFPKEVECQNTQN